MSVSRLNNLFFVYFWQRLKRKEGRRPAVLLGLRDTENDSGVIRVYARRLKTTSNPSLTIPVSSSITTEQVIKEALARFRLEDEDISAYQLVKVTLEAGRGKQHYNDLYFKGSFFNYVDKTR